MRSKNMVAVMYCIARNNNIQLCTLIVPSVVSAISSGLAGRRIIERILIKKHGLVLVITYHISCSYQRKVSLVKKSGCT